MVTGWQIPYTAAGYDQGCPNQVLAWQRIGDKAYAGRRYDCAATGGDKVNAISWIQLVNATH